jgi:hypothetical protein
MFHAIIGKEKTVLKIGITLLRKAFSIALFSIFRSPPERIVDGRLLDVLQGTLKKDEKLGILQNWTSG